MAKSKKADPIEHLNPEGLHKNPAYSQAVVVTGAAKTIYIGGQNSVDADGNLVGKGDLGVQTEKCLQNIATILAAAGAGWEHVIKINLYLLPEQPLHLGFQAFQKVVGEGMKPPAITVAIVAGLAVPDALVEIEAVAVVPETA